MQGISEDARQKSLRYSVLDAGSYAAMVGFGETYFIPLLLFIGASNFQVGMFTAAPQFFVAFSQFTGLYLVNRFLVRKSVIMAAVASQMIFLGAILLTVIMNWASPLVFMVLAIGYYAVNGVALPPWNSLLGDLTTDADRGAYFGRRSGISQLSSFLALFAGGVLLQHFQNSGVARYGFIAILSAAFLARCLSFFAFTRHVEVPYSQPAESYFSFRDFVRRSPKSNFARFVYFIALMNLAIQMSAPYFVAYMIRDLQFSYLQYTLAQGVFIAVQFIAMPRWGAVADRYGNRIVLYLTGIMLCFIPLLWFLSYQYYYIIAIQILAGIAWAGWFLSTANFIFDAVTPPKRARCAAYLNFFNSMGFALGALLGAFLVTRAPTQIDTGAMKIVFFSPLEFLFLLSSGIRLLVLFIFMPTVHEVRTVDRAETKDVFMMLVNVRPLGGMRLTPYTGAISDRWKRSHEKRRKKKQEKHEKNGLKKQQNGGPERAV